MAYYAMLVVVEADDEEEAHGTVSALNRTAEVAQFVGTPWEVQPINDLAAEQAAGKWITAEESADYYPNADPEFGTIESFDQNPAL